MDYIGEKCAACGQTFTADDDIVVCPDCGSPHHRGCWQRENRCSNEGFHAVGSKWQRTVSAAAPTVELRICPVCRYPNNADSQSCEKCGAPLRSESSASGASYRTFTGDDILNVEYAGFDPNEDLGGATLREVSGFVGTNTIYYIPIFKRMKDVGTKVSFNLACLAFPSLYFANRKMWGWAVFAAILSIFMSLPLVILYMGSIGGIPESIASSIENNKELLNTLDSIFGILDWLTRLAFCLLGNRIYFKFVLSSLRRMKARNLASKENIALAGGIRPFNMVLITLIKGALAMGAGMLTYMIFSMMTAVSDFSTVAMFLL